jgi:hypothetical protein
VAPAAEGAIWLPGAAAVATDPPGRTGNALDELDAPGGEPGVPAGGGAPPALGLEDGPDEGLELGLELGCELGLEDGLGVGVGVDPGVGVASGVGCAGGVESCGRLPQPSPPPPPPSSAATVSTAE